MISSRDWSSRWYCGLRREECTAIAFALSQVWQCLDRRRHIPVPGCSYNSKISIGYFTDISFHLYGKMTKCHSTNHVLPTPSDIETFFLHNHTSAFSSRLPSSCNCCIARFSVSNANIVVIAEGTARNRLVPMP